MYEQVIYLVVGAFLAVVGGFLQSVYNEKKERIKHIRIKREEAYLGYINALLRLRENQDGSIFLKDYFPIYHPIKAQILLYGSERVNKKIKEYDLWLHECCCKTAFLAVT